MTKFYGLHAPAEAWAEGPIAGFIRHAVNQSKHWLWNVAIPASQAAVEAASRPISNLVVIRQHKPKWLVVVPFIVMAVLQAIVLVVNTSPSQHPQGFITRTSPDFVYSALAKPPDRLLADGVSFTHGNCNLLHGTESGNHTIPTNNDEWKEMLGQLKIEVDASSYTEADKARVVGYIMDVMSRHERLSSESAHVLVDMERFYDVVDHHLLALVHYLSELKILLQQDSQDQDKPKEHPTTFVQWLTDHYLAYFPSDSQTCSDGLHGPGSQFSDPVQSYLVQATKHHSDQLYNCVEDASERWMSNTNLYSWWPRIRMDFSPSILCRSNVDQGIVNWIWLSLSGQISESNCEIPSIAAMERLAKEERTSMRNKLNAVDKAQTQSWNLQRRFWNAQWRAPYGTPFAAWLKERHSDLKEEMDALRRDIKMRAEIREKVWG
ncbi:MAG: hypothetical protein Q9168_006685 [Polycauliona sp. 1 TL-2023]